MKLHLSKSKYCNAVQCPKMLWMKKNKPEEFDESVMNQVVLDNGSEVGDLAMGLFGDYVEVPFDRDLGKMIKKMTDCGVNIQPTLSTAFEKLYGYTSTAKGVRHAGDVGGKDVSFEEARFMLVACSAFINYVKGNLAKVNPTVSVLP